MPRYAVLILLSGFLFFGCTTIKYRPAEAASLPAASLLPFGRTNLNADQNLALISSASHVGFSFEGKECSVTLSVPGWLSHNYLQYELDGEYQKRLRISSKEGEPFLISATGDGKHTVWLYKATEAHTGPVMIHNISGKNLKVLQRPVAPLIEFIGNSITCGAAADPSEVPCGTGVYHDQHNAYMAYGPRVARALGVNFLLSSVSGIGVYRNWNSDGPTMPQVYENADFQVTSSSRWKFAAYSPKVVSISLGTNDFSQGNGKKERESFDSTRFIKAYVDFVQVVKSHYPAAQIALLSSPMIGGEAGVVFRNCLLSVKAKVDALNPSEKPVALFFFQPMQASGCTGHPSVEEHAIMAGQLVPFYQKLIQ